MCNSRLWIGICWGLGAAALPAPAQTFDPGADPAFATAVLVEAGTGAVLFGYHADAPRSPASTQKLLLQLVVMDLVKSGKFSLEEPVKVSARASRMGGSQVFLKEGEAFSLNEMMEAISIPSANDACVAVAEHIGGSVKGFVDMMNQRADDLKLTGTRCVNVHGLDDTPKQSGNKTTANDLAHITRGLLAHPEILAWSAVRYKPFRDGRFMLYNTNKLLGRFRGLDGIKTGYTKRAGSCLVATAKRGDMRLISVILGCRSEKIRDAETRRLLSWGFNNFSRVPIVHEGESMGTVVLDWGMEPEVKARTKSAAVAVLSRAQQKQIRRQIHLPGLRPAPVEAGEKLGSLTVSLSDSLLVEVDVVAAKSVARMGLWDKFLSYF